jgi:hypothetical protein
MVVPCGVFVPATPYDFIRVFPGGGKPEKKYSVRVRFLRTGKIPEAAGMKAE